MKKGAVVFSLICLMHQAYAQLHVRFQPDEWVYVYETVPPGAGKVLYSALIQNMALVNLSESDQVIDNVTVRALKEGKEFQSKIISKPELVSAARTISMYKQAGMLDLLEFQYQTQSYLKNATFSSGDTLEKGEAIILIHQAFLFDQLPDELEIEVASITKKRREISRATLKVVNHISSNTYQFPLKGQWFVAAGPSLIGHHRWATIQEFAFDFVQFGENTKTYSGDGTKLTDYYAYGADVFAVADGVVVRSQNDIAEREDILKQPNEADEDYLQRLMQYQQQLLMQGFDQILGNHVIIEHANGEYSYYVHLKTGSVTVKAGDSIKQGDKIGLLGHSGNSTEPHLHFHLANKMDVQGARSIPIRFSNVRIWPEDDGRVTHLHSGQLVESF